MDDDEGLTPEEPWFEPKRYGYGAGLPIAWRGWALLGGFIAVMALCMMLFSRLARSGSLFAIAVVVALLWFVSTCQRHTRGGWRWRWGDRD
ncbi:MAG: hypothetical protein J7494_00045 [Sphingobium sp.]|nr:hypothetical protein [Sphingobium sp.]